jgi:AP-2 complex subunit alpha
MLGYDVDFGHAEAVSLISAPKYPEKQVHIFDTCYRYFGFRVFLC